MLKVKKRTGEIVDFNSDKIKLAISKAGQVDQDMIETIISNVMSTDKSIISVEEIQEKIELSLMKDYPEIAQNYIRYRYKRNLIRETNKINNTVLELISNKNDYIKGENSNKNPVIASTQRDYMAGESSKDLSRRLLIPHDIMEAHDEGIIHFHDLDYFAQKIHNCCLVDTESMLQNGTVISNTLIEKPHSFRTACNILTQIIAQIASNQYGGQSESLSSLVPFVDISRQSIRKEVKYELESLGFDVTKINQKDIDDVVLERLKKEITNGIQIIQYQILTLMTTNGQTPFTSLYLYLNEVEEDQKEDLALIIEEILNQRIQGIKNEKNVWVTPSFPKLLYVLEEDNISEGSKYYYLTELAAKCTAKRMIPDYISEKVLLETKYPLEKLLTIKERRDKWGDSKIWGRNPFEYMTDEECDILQKYVETNYRTEKSSLTEEQSDIINSYNLKHRDLFPIAYPCMGCRSFLTPDYIHYKYYGRFNQGVVTLNLVDVGLSAVYPDNVGEKSLGDVYKTFWSILDKRLDLTHRAMQLRCNRLRGTISDTSPIHWQYGGLSHLDKGEIIDPLLFDNYSTLSLGYAGLYECVYAVTGKSHTDPEVKEFALDILRKLNDKCEEWRKEENISYSLYGTPIESTTYKFAKKLKDRFGIIKEVTDHDYITNSYHVNVREKIDPFTKLKFESEFQKLSPGGSISYIEASNLSNNLEAVLSVIKYIYDNIMYAELNIKSDYCQVCGYEGEIKIVKDSVGKLIWECPNCKNRDQSKMNVARRTCGYIGVNFWNQGRTEEIKDRFVHLGSGEL